MKIPEWVESATSALVAEGFQISNGDGVSAFKVNVTKPVRWARHLIRLKARCPACGIEFEKPAGEAIICGKCYTINPLMYDSVHLEWNEPLTDTETKRRPPRPPPEPERLQDVVRRAAEFFDDVEKK